MHDDSSPTYGIPPHLFIPSAEPGETGLCVCGHERFTGVHVTENGHAENRLYRSKPFDRVQPEKIQWLWERRIPLGKLTVLDGDPNVGKSTLSIDFAAHVSTGAPWPDGTPCPEGAVLLLSAEDGQADTVRPRLDAAGAEISKVEAFEVVLNLTDDGVGERDPHLGDVAALEQAITDKRAKLLVVDVFMAYLPPGVDSHKDQDVRSVLRRLKEMAERTGAAVLLIRHLNKSSAGNALYRGGGSIGIVGAARSALLAGRHPDDKGRFVLAPLKHNLSAAPAALSYRIVDHNGAGKVEWEGEVDCMASELMGDDEDRSETAAMAEVLRDHLTSNGGVAAAKECRELLAEHFGNKSGGTLKRVREKAGVTFTKRDGFGKGSFWRLIEDTQ